MKFKKPSPFQILIHLGSLTPLALLLWDYFNQNLTINPIQDITLRTGKTALVLLVLTLACTPINTLFGFRQAIKVRRALGLYTFLYAFIHGMIFIGLDYGFNWAFIKTDLIQKRYVLIGAAAFLVMLPLAITSTKKWQKRLRKNWKRLHRLVYLAGVFAVIHYTWLVKADIREPLTYGAVVVLLLSLRLPSLRQWASRLGLKNLNLKILRSEN